MKPRLIRDRGVWVCALGLRRCAYGLAGVWPHGHGYTPRDAYADWRAQQ
jgi:hypothetical protein